ncbi:MAG: response regulator [Desulfobacterales bacterium]|nr:response regulator [Desulfobacterales bacterium]
MNFTPKAGNSGLNVLIVDDAQDNIELLFGLLARSGYQVRAALNGRAALKAVKKKLPDLILLDIRMPDMDGFEVCRRLKFERKSAQIPVIFISGLEESRDKVRGFDLGGVDYITKPFQPEEVLARVRTHMALTQMKQNLEQVVEQRTSELTRLASAVEHIDEGLIIVDTNAIVLYVNPSFEAMTGILETEILGKPYPDFDKTDYDGISLQEIIRRAGKGKTWSGRQSVTNENKETRVFYTNVSPIFHDSGGLLGYVFVRRDVTELTRVEKMLQQAQKMEAIGTLAGGIAHDFNNILFAIMGNTELTMEMTKDLPEIHAGLTEVYNSANRAKELVSQILAFSRQTEQEKYPVRIVPVIKEVAKFLQASLPSTIKIIIRIKTGRDLILADPTQIHQILMNLCTNASHAMKESGGKITVRLYDAPLASPILARYSGVEKKDYVCLEITDTGCGIKKKYLDTIFDPYFTTKEQGEGTGLGLSVVHGIVKSHGGIIDVASKEDQGTAFTVLLPLHEDDETPPVLPASDKSPEGSERLLLVDDEDSIVRVGRKALTKLGYKVKGMCDPREALKLLKDNPDKFDLVITDKTMPGMTGFMLAREAKNIVPELPVILCTGYSEEGEGEKVRAAGIDGVIEKPVDLTAMALAVRRVLDQGNSPD